MFAKNYNDQWQFYVFRRDSCSGWNPSDTSRESERENFSKLFESQQQSHVHCLHGGRDGVWPTFGFPDENTVLYLGSCGGLSHPAAEEESILSKHTIRGTKNKQLMKPKQIRFYSKANVKHLLNSLILRSDEQVSFQRNETAGKQRFTLHTTCNYPDVSNWISSIKYYFQKYYN